MSAQESVIDKIPVIEDALKTIGEPVKLKDIIDLTKDKVDWRDDAKAYSYQMRVVLMNSSSIKKAGYGKYKYVEQGENNKKGDDVLETSDNSQELLDSFRSQTKNIVHTKQKFKVGDIVEGFVSGIEDYGAFIKSEDGEMEGLIHITNIKDGIVNDVSRHFRHGDKVTAKIIAIRNGGKISLSTKDYILPDYFRREELEEKLSGALDNISDTNAQNNRITEVPNKAGVKNKNNEDREVLQYIQSIIGVVSDDAQNRIRHLIESNGMFKFAVALAEVQKDFNVDVGLLLAERIEEKMSGGL